MVDGFMGEREPLFELPGAEQPLDGRSRLLVDGLIGELFGRRDPNIQIREERAPELIELLAAMREDEALNDEEIAILVGRHQKELTSESSACCWAGLLLR
jgi:hypothetical protein